MNGILELQLLLDIFKHNFGVQVLRATHLSYIGPSFALVYISVASTAVILSWVGMLHGSAELNPLPIVILLLLN